MLEVHPPHTTAHTWRDFFVHIATIVIGLLIAVGLEQSIEAFHRHRERVQLMDDLRHEAESRIATLRENDRSFLVLETWLRSTLDAALAAKPSGGYVEFRCPGPMGPAPGDGKPPNAVWAAAQSSGILSVLDRQQIEDWERVDYFAQLAQRDTETSQTALRSVVAISDHLGLDFSPDKKMRTTVEGANELTRALGVVIESIAALRHDDQETIKATEAIL